MAQKSILSFFTSPKAKAKPPPETPASNSKSPDKKDESNNAEDSKSCPPEDIAEEQVDKNIEEETPKSEETPSETNLESGKNKEAAVVTIIPRRKTARKQFSNRKKKPKSDVHPLQDHFKGKTPEPVSKIEVKVSKIVLSVPKWEAETGSLKLGTENGENAVSDNNRVNHPQSNSSNEDTKESGKLKVKKSTPKIRASLTDKNAKKPRKRQAKNISNQLESESPDKGTKIPGKCQAEDTDDKLKSESLDKEAEKPEECQAEDDTGDQLESEPSEEEAKKPGKRQAEDTDDRFKSNSPDKEAKKSKKLHTKDVDDKLESESPHKAIERSKKRKAKSCVRKIESDSSDEDMGPHETNSAKSLQPDSSDEDAELPIVRKRVKRNVITDDSPLKMAAPTPKVVVENYGTKLDKFIMKPRKSRDTESVTVSALLKSEGEEEKIDVSELQNQTVEVQVRTPSSAKKSKDKTKLKGKNGSEEETQDPEKPDKKPIVNAFDVLKKKGRMANNTSQSCNDDTEEKSTNNDSKEKTTNNDTKETNTKKGSTTSTYCPSKNHYHPIEDASWKKGETVPYLALARTLEEIENTSGRLKMIEILANYFRSVIVLSPDDLLQSVYLCLNRLAPEYHNIELGVGETLLMKALAQATGRTLDKIKADVTNKGDLGLVAENSRGNQRVMFAFPKLTVPSVFIKFKEIAEMSGNSVMAKKTSKIQALFSACRECEAKYIIRSLSGKLRIGLAEQSVLSALSQAITITPPGQDYPPDTLNSSSSMSKDSFKKHLDSNTLILKSTYCECPNYDMIIPILLKDGLAELPNRCQLTPGIPLKPMLAHPASSLEEVLRRFDGSEFTCEFKYDGERAQIHKLENDDIKIYSRNQEDNTSKYPDIIARFSKALAPDTKSCILDAEVVAWDKDAQQIQPFQVLSTRKRKDAADSEITVQVCIQAFDLLYVNGEALVKKPLRERRNLLRKCFEEVPNEFSFVKSMDGNSTDVMQEFLEESIKGSCEGLMVKALDVASTYEIAKRSHNWLKLKKDYLDGVGDTLDLVVIGGWFGKGKRTGNYGGFLLACYDNETEEFQTICKIGTGFKDEDLEVHAKFFKEHTIEAARSYYRYDAAMEPDQWFDACQVWEVKCADLSISPVHKAACGIVDPVKGISLRFPRFLRIRDDKKAEDATTSVQVASMYNNQEQVRNQAPKDSKADDLDFY